MDMCHRCNARPATDGGTLCDACRACSLCGGAMDGPTCRHCDDACPGCPTCRALKIRLPDSPYFRRQRR